MPEKFNHRSADDKASLRDECLRLRREERLSLKEIEKRTGASRGSLSNWLRNDPLTDDELAERQRTRHREKGPKTGTRIWTEREQSTIGRLMSDRLGSSQAKGRVAEAVVVARLTALGFSTYRPAFEGQRTDVVAESWATGRLIRIQVKHVQEGKHGWPCILLRRSNGRGQSVRYEPGEFDVIVGYDTFSDRAFVFTEAEVRHMKKSVSCSEESMEAWIKLVQLDRASR